MSFVILNDTTYPNNLNEIVIRCFYPGEMIETHSCASIITDEIENNPDLCRFRWQNPATR
jgi:hypothetical protein